MATCPECDYDEIDTDDYEEGDKVSCPECGKNLVLVGPDELDFAAGADDDDDDLEDEDDDLDEDELDDDDDEDDEEEETEDFDE
jgi:ribonuclease E